MIEGLRQLMAISVGSRGRPWSLARLREFYRFRVETLGGEGYRPSRCELRAFLRWAARERRAWRALD
jgi:hypothetical protein